MSDPQLTSYDREGRVIRRDSANDYDEAKRYAKSLIARISNIDNVVIAHGDNLKQRTVVRNNRARKMHK